MTPKDIFIAIFVCALWGFNFSFVKLGLQEIPPMLYSALRFIVAAIPVLGFVKKPNVPWHIIIGIGSMLGFVKFTLTTLGMNAGMSPGLTSLVLQTQVFFTIILSFILFKKGASMRQILGMSISFLGIILIGFAIGGQASLLGFFLILGAALAWAFSNILFQKAGSVDMFPLVVWTCLIPPLPLLVLSYVFEGGVDVLWPIITNMSSKTALYLIFSAWGSTWIGSTLWAILLQKYHAAKVAPYSLLIPVFGLTCSWGFVGEEYSLSTIGASALIFIGLIINQSRKGGGQDFVVNNSQSNEFRLPENEDDEDLEENTIYGNADCLQPTQPNQK